jgi:multidrug efflux pump subunit AcrB
MLLTVKVSTNKEEQAADLIAAKAKKKNLHIFSLARIHGLRGYIFLEELTGNIHIYKSETENQATRIAEIVYYEIYDTSKFVRKRMSTMVRNGILSMILVAVMLLLFMNWRIALLVVAGLLVSFFGTFIYLKLVNSSFNMISLFSLILVLGMLVDDAIVVCENVYRHMEEGKSPYDAALIGTKEVLLPVIGTVSTTIVAFLPLLLTTGMMGKFVAIIPQVVTVALLLSLIEVIFILPSHLVDFVKPEDMSLHLIETGRHKSIFRNIFFSIDNFLKKIRIGVDKMLKRVFEYYRYALKIALRRRWLVLLCALLAFISALMLIKTGVLKFKLF